MNFSSRKFYNISSSDEDQKLGEANDDIIIRVIGNSSDVEIASKSNRDVDIGTGDDNDVNDNDKDDHNGSGDGIEITVDINDDVIGTGDDNDNDKDDGNGSCDVIDITGDIIDDAIDRQIRAISRTSNITDTSVTMSEYASQEQCKNNLKDQTLHSDISLSDSDCSIYEPSKQEEKFAEKELKEKICVEKKKQKKRGKKRT